MPDTTYSPVTTHTTDGVTTYNRDADEQSYYSQFFNLRAAVEYGHTATGTPDFLIAVIVGDELAGIVNQHGEEYTHVIGELRDIAAQLELGGVAGDPERLARRGLSACVAGRELRGQADHRRALVTLTPGLLAAMLRLPDGVRVVAADYDTGRTMIRLTVEGGPLPQVEEGYALTDIGSGAVVYQLDHDGHLWTRVEWELPEDSRKD